MRSVIRKVCYGFLSCVLFVWGCSDAPSQLAPKHINEAIITGMDPIYLIGPDDNLSIFPEISFTLDTNETDTARYRYEWIFLVRPIIGIKYDYETIGTEKSLIDFDISKKFSRHMGVYNFMYRVIDRHTDTFSEWPFRVLIANSYYEGWVVLNEVQQGSRVDMLSYSIVTDSFDYLRDVVDFSLFGTASGGAPIFIEQVFARNYPLNLGGVVVGTDEDLFACSSIDLEVVDAYYQSYNELREIPASAKRGASFYTTIDKQFLQVNEISYQCDESGTFDRQAFVPVSTRLASSATEEGFRASVHVALDIRSLGEITVLFDEDADEFVWYSTKQGYCSGLFEANNFGHESEWTLLYLEHSQFGGGQYTALLREDNTGILYFTRFTIYDQLEFSKVDAQSGLYKANKMALDPNTGDFYFSVGREVFEYKDGISRKIYDFEDEITMLKFNRFVLLFASKDETINGDRYQRYEDNLLVATHNNVQPESSGKLFLFDIVKNSPSQQFNGFSKIVDVTYKER